MNEVLLKRMKKYRKTLDFRNSTIKRLGDLDNLIVGEVMGIHDCERFCFIVKANGISVSDLRDHKKSAIDFFYNTTTGLFHGKGVRSNYKECERLLAYVFLLMENLDGDVQRKEVH